MQLFDGLSAVLPEYKVPLKFPCIIQKIQVEVSKYELVAKKREDEEIQKRTELYKQ